MWQRLRRLVAALSIVLSVPSPGLAAYLFIPIDVPGAQASGGTAAFGINGSTAIVGCSYDTDDQGLLISHGFLTTDLGTTFTPVDVATGSLSFNTANGIHAGGSIVGTYQAPFPAHGFLQTLGINITIDFPGADLIYGTHVMGINGLSSIVGFYFKETEFTSSVHGFVNLTAFDVPLADATMANGINDAGAIVGSFVDTGLFVPFFYPCDALALATNPVGNHTHGFLTTDSGKTFTTFDVPSFVLSTEANGINNKGQVVGSVDYRHGFVTSKIGTNYTILDVPGATATRAFGIDDAGEIVGHYFDSVGLHGFLAIPFSGKQKLSIKSCLNNPRSCAEALSTKGAYRKIDCSDVRALCDALLVATGLLTTPGAVVPSSFFLETRKVSAESAADLESEPDETER